MSYYDPIYPSIQATRLQLQRSFLALEEKLRIQRQLDFDLQNQQRSRRATHLTAFDQQRRYRQTFLGEERFFRQAYDRQLAQRIKFSQREQENDINHLSRLERLERQRLRLGLQRQRVNSVGLIKQGYLQNKSPYRTFGRQLDYDEDQTLIKKYQDGTRAKQFRNQMNSRTNYNSATKISRHGIEQQIDRSPYKNLKYQSQRKGIGKQFQGVNAPTRFYNNRAYDRYDNLGSSGDKNQYKCEKNNDHRFNNNGHHSSQKYGADNGYKQQVQRNKNDLPKFGMSENSFNQNKGILKNKSSPMPNIYKNPQNTIEEESQRNILRPVRSFQQDEEKKSNFPDRPSRGNMKSSKKQESLSSRGKSRSQKDLQGSKAKKVQKQGYNTPYASYLDGNSQRSPSKTKRSRVKNSTLTRSRNISGPLQHCAMEKIRNRLKLSYVVFKDSKFKNIRHELSHLFNTYDCELKLRRQLKEKINNHPSVLKKHAMVVQ